MMEKAIYRGGRAVVGFALGDDQFAKLDTELAAMRTDAARAGATADPTAAVAQYKATGQHGADVLGPEIDAAGPSDQTQPITHHAWVLNGQLAALSADAVGALSAKSLLGQMLDDYAQAIAVSKQAHGGGDQQPSVWPYVLIPAGALVLFGGIWLLSR